MNSSQIKKNAVNATKWASITELSAKLVLPITNMILARILAPEAFGILATVIIIISFADMFADAGFQKFLIQYEFPSEENKFQYANVAFWTNFIISMLLWGIIFSYSEQIALILGNPELSIVIAVACIQLPITSFSSIQMALFRRHFDFKTLFYVRIVSVILPFIITIPLAYLGFDYWSLIIGNLVGQLFNALILTIKSKWKPRLFYNIKILKDMLSFSIWSLVEAIFIWLTAWVDVLIIGSLLNSYYMGLYTTSLNIINSMMALVTSATVPVLFSTLSRLQNNTEQFNKVFFNTQRLVSIIVLPVGVGIFLFSDLITWILLGENWSEASQIIGNWALTSAIMIVFGHYCSEVYRAKGQPKLSFLAQVLHLIVLVPVCIYSVQFGFWALVFVRSWIRIQFVLVHFLIMKYAIGIPISKIIRNVIPTIISASLMGIFGFILKQLNDGLMWQFLIIFLCCIFYFVILNFLFPKIKTDFLLFIRLFKKTV